MSDRVVTAHVPVALAREVDRLAGRLDRPRGWIVKEALARYVELESKRHALTLEALADVDGVKRLGRHPRIGPRWPEFAPREVRRFIVGDYEVRYEIAGGELVVLRIWHVYEDR